MTRRATWCAATVAVLALCIDVPKGLCLSEARDPVRNRRRVPRVAWLVDAAIDRGAHAARGHRTDGAALWLRGLNLNPSASVGFIAVFGVAVLNGVVMIAAINVVLPTIYEVVEGWVERRGAGRRAAAGVR